MWKWLAQRKKAVAAFVAWVVSEVTVINQLHPDSRVTAVLTVLGLLGVGAVHQVTNAK